MSGNLPFSHETVVHSLMREAVALSQTIRNRICFMVKLNHTAYRRMAIQVQTNSSIPLKIWDHPLQCQHFVRYVSVEQYFSAAVLLSVGESWSPSTLALPQRHSLCRIQSEHGRITELLNDNIDDYDITETVGRSCSEGRRSKTDLKTNERNSPDYFFAGWTTVCTAQIMRQLELAESHSCRMFNWSIVDHLRSWASYVLFDFARTKSEGKRQRERKRKREREKQRETERNLEGARGREGKKLKKTEKGERE